jgi:hypothetical protein
MTNYKHFPQKTQIRQLYFPGWPVTLQPGYPRRGLLRCLALCNIYGWPWLAELTERQLARMEGRL